MLHMHIHTHTGHVHTVFYSKYYTTDMFKFLFFWSPNYFSHDNHLVLCVLSSHPPSVQRYDPRTNEWSSMSPLPIQRSGFSSAVVDGMLFLVGGCNNLCKVNTVDCFDPEKDEWFPVAKMSVRRSGLGVGVAPAFLYWSPIAQFRSCDPQQILVFFLTIV